MRPQNIQILIGAAKERRYDFLNPGPGIARDGWHLMMAKREADFIRALRRKLQRPLKRAQTQKPAPKA